MRGFVYEAAGTVAPGLLSAGAGLVRSAAATWRIPVEVIAEPASADAEWARETADLALRLLANRAGTSK